MIPIDQVLPSLVMFISGLAGIIYLATGDVGRGLYWVSACSITIAVTWLIK
jgi:hypothetical protein